MRLLKGLVIAFVITLALNCMGVNAANYFIMNEVVVPAKQGIYATSADKNENSIQYIKNTTSSNSVAFQARLYGEDIFGDRCYTNYTDISKSSFTKLGNATTNGCGTFPVNGKAVLNVRTKRNYDKISYFWGTWITTTTMYNEYIKLFG